MIFEVLESSVSAFIIIALFFFLDCVRLVLLFCKSKSFLISFQSIIVISVQLWGAVLGI